MRLNTRFFALLLLLALATPASAQEALVLSGGGSRGLAHAGVFLALEELGYDPDIVVGTSMGAVVGALYAAGYEPEEIRRRILSIAWSRLFTPTPVVIGPERAVRFPMLTMDLDLARLRVSRGLFGQWRINRALVQLLFDANAKSRGDFDRLARRYRAVAADLETGDAVVLSSGDLARAARASMAVPGFFAPVAWDGRVLVDGGIVDNLPTALARTLGATRVIAVDVSRPSAKIESQAPLAVISRALDLMQENTQRDSVQPDALLVPDIAAGVTGATFPDDPTPLVTAGRAAARATLQPAPSLEGRGKRPLPAPPDSFSALIVEAPDSALVALARRAFRGVAPGPYDADVVLAAVDRLYATGLFEGVWPRVTDEPGRAPALTVRLDAQPKVSFAGAAGYDNDRGGRAWATLDRYTTLVRRPAVLSASAAVGGIERWGALSARVYPLSNLGLAWSAGAHVQERAVRFFADDIVGEKEVARAGGWLALELPLILRDRLTTAAVRAEWIDVEDGSSGTAVGPLLRYATLPANAPVVGTPFVVEAERRWGSLTYSRAQLSGSRTLDLRGVLLAAMLDLRITSTDAPADVRPALGDEHAMPGLRWGEERGRARTVGGVDVAFPIYGGHLRFRARTGAAFAQLEWEDSDWVTGGQAGIIWPTPLGAVEAAWGIATRGDGRFDINVGRRF